MERDEFVIAEIRHALESQKRLAESAMRQLGEDDFHWTPHPDCNSIAIIVKHLAGNMRSRWTDFLTTDGEKPDRNRDGEFIDDTGSRREILRLWEEGWGVLFQAVDSLQPGGLYQEIRIRGESQSVARAILGQLGHYAQHVGQIVYLAKLRLGDEWRTVSIPRRRP